MPCIPPVIRRPRKTVSPRKRSSGPCDGGFQRKASCESFILSRDSPDSVISGPGPLMPERRISPPLVVTIPCFQARSKRENAAGHGKKRLNTHFFQDGQICWSSFADADASATKKTHPETVSGCGEVRFFCSPDHFGRDPLISAEGIPEPGSACLRTCSCTARKADRR